MPDARGVANIYGALSLVAMAEQSWGLSNDYLAIAEAGYRRPDGSVDPSGTALVARRHRILEAIR